MHLSEEDISLLKHNDIDYYKKNVLCENTINVGDICVEEKPSIDGEDLPKRFYKIIGKVDKLHDITINAYLVKEVFRMEDGNWGNNNGCDFRTKFSLSRSDCKYLNIDYEDGIEVYPFPNNDELFHKFNDDVKITNENKDLNIHYENLATYPVSEADGAIRHILIQLNGFQEINNNYLLMSNGQIISKEKFVRTLRINLKRHIGKTNPISAQFLCGESLSYRFVTRNKKQNKEELVDHLGNIYIEIDTFRSSERTKDGIIGISPQDLYGLNANDLFNVFFDDSAIIGRRMLSQSREADIFEHFDRYLNRLDWELENTNEQFQRSTRYRYRSGRII